MRTGWRALCKNAGLEDATVSQRDGTVRFASIDALVSTERACAWTLGGLLDDAQFERLRREARSVFKPFVDSGGKLAFSMPALVIGAGQALRDRAGRAAATALHPHPGAASHLSHRPSLSACLTAGGITWTPGLSLTRRGAAALLAAEPGIRMRWVCPTALAEAVDQPVHRAIAGAVGGDDAAQPEPREVVDRRVDPLLVGGAGQVKSTDHHADRDGIEQLVRRRPRNGDALRSRSRGGYPCKTPPGTRSRRPA